MFSLPVHDSLLEIQVNESDPRRVPAALNGGQATVNAVISLYNTKLQLTQFDIQYLMFFLCTSPLSLSASPSLLNMLLMCCPLEVKTWRALELKYNLN